MKKKRSDAGTVRMGEPDQFFLRWIGEQYAIHEGHLRMLVSRESEYVAEGALISPTGLRKRYMRWVRAGWVKRQKMIAYQPSWIWLTKKGLKDFGLGYKHRVPILSTLEHYHAVNEVRLWVELRISDDDRWVSEREILVRRGESKDHLADAELMYQNLLIGVEVERTQKSKKRMNVIMDDLRTQYKFVWYFASESCYKAVERAIEARTDRSTFVLYKLPLYSDG